MYMSIAPEDLAVKVTKIEGDVSAIRKDLTHSNELSRMEMGGVKTSLEKISEAVEVMLRNHQETAFLRRDISNAQQDIAELHQRMDKRKEATDPIILEAQQFLASFKVGSRIAIYGLGILQLCIIGFLGFNETRYQELSTKVMSLQIEVAKHSVEKSHQKPH